MMNEIRRFEPAIRSLLSQGRWVFAVAILCLGIERLVCVGSLVGTLIESGRFRPMFGVILVVCSVGLLFKRTLRIVAMTLGGFPTHLISASSSLYATTPRKRFAPSG
jgi:hypothetical protein